jgi:hypothetical protein
VVCRGRLSKYFHNIRVPTQFSGRDSSMVIGLPVLLLKRASQRPPQWCSGGLSLAGNSEALAISSLVRHLDLPQPFLIASQLKGVERKGIMPNTIQIHRVLCAAPEKAYRAFLDTEATAKWL